MITGQATIEYLKMNYVKNPFYNGSSGNTVIIFDWDDTICPSSFIEQHKIEDIGIDLPLHYQNIFIEIARSAEKCLRLACQQVDSRVLIITNSDDGWVRYSAEQYLPSLVPLLFGRDQIDVSIVSARTRYEQFYPNQPLCWKAAAFAHEVNECFQSQDLQRREYLQSYTACNHLAKAIGSMSMSDDEDGYFQNTNMEIEDDKVSTISQDSEASFDTARSRISDISKSSGSSTDGESVIPVVYKPEKHQIISFGDGMEERTAVKIVAAQLNSSWKSVMFVQGPTPVQLLGGLVMLKSHMEDIVSGTEHLMKNNQLDLEIGKHQAERTAERYLKAMKKMHKV